MSQSSVSTGARPSEVPPAPPSLSALFAGFFAIGSMSFGGGLAAWIRRETVERRRWIEDPQFLTGYALSQIVPGAVFVNLSVFIGTRLRGVRGAVAAVAGLMAVPLMIYLSLGTLYVSSQGGPAHRWIGPILTGVGAAAIGLNLAVGIRLARRNLRRRSAWLVAAITVVAVGVLRVPLLWTLAVMIPTSFTLAWWEQQR